MQSAPKLVASDIRRRYSVMKRGNKEYDLIPIERIEYINDKMVNHEFRKSENK